MAIIRRKSFRGQRQDGRGEHCSVQDQVQGVELYALMALDACSEKRGVIVSKGR